MALGQRGVEQSGVVTRALRYGDDSNAASNAALNRLGNPRDVSDNTVVDKADDFEDRNVLTRRRAKRLGDDGHRMPRSVYPHGHRRVGPG